MKILPIRPKTFKADTKTIDAETGEYKDPMMHWPLRAAAFTNEIGEALRPVIKGYATLSWIPALMYIGADIYDKYKNDQTEYNPNSRRCLKQAIFQGMASIALPLCAVKLGQHIISYFSSLASDKLSIIMKDDINKLAQQYVANGNMRAYNDKSNKCVEKFCSIVKNNLDYKEQLSHTSNPFKKGFYKLKNVMFKLVKGNTEENINNYAKNIINELITLREDIFNPKETFKTNEYYKMFENNLKSGQTNSVAIKSVLNKSLVDKGSKGRILMTLSGFLALGLAIKPIDRFVENVLICKIVGPSIDGKKNLSE